MPWTVRMCKEFEAEFLRLPKPVQKSITSKVRFLEHKGPDAGRPHVDTLKGARYGLKELRAAEAWRVAFVFDPRPEAILLVAASKKGMNSGLFYDRLRKTAQDRYERHLEDIAED